MAPERLCLPAKGTFLTPSETEARGRVDEDLTDVVEPVGETTGRVAVVGLEVVDAVGLDEVEDDKGGFEIDDDRGGLEVEEDMDGFKGGGAEDLEGTTEALRAGPVAEVPVDGAFATGVGLVGLEAGASALTDFLRVAAAEETLWTANDAALETALVAGLVAGAAFTAPAPKVPELRIFLTKGVGGPVDLFPVVFANIAGLDFSESAVGAGSLFLPSSAGELLASSSSTAGTSSVCGGCVPCVLLSPFF